jgi:hypothetical protein
MDYYKIEGKPTRFTADEMDLLKMTFKDNEALLKLMRKVFLPEYDFTAPLDQIIDLWMTVDVRTLTPDQAYVRLIARNELISHIEFQLKQLQTLANIKEETKEEKKSREEKDSSQ